MQQQFDDNGMVHNAPIRITYKDVELGKTTSEEVSYTKGCEVMLGKQNKSDMVNLPKAGWIKAREIQRFASVEKKSFNNSNIDDDWKYFEPVFERSFEKMRQFLQEEIKRISERLLVTGKKDPRLRVFPRLLEIKDRAQLVKEWGRFNSGEQ